MLGGVAAPRIRRLFHRRTSALLAIAALSVTYGKKRRRWPGLVIAAVAVGFAEYLSFFFPSLSTARVVFSLDVPWGIAFVDDDVRVRGTCTGPENDRPRAVCTRESA